MAGIAGSITIAFLGMRAALDVGGHASGGPYVIATPCPDGTWLLPVAIFVGPAFVFLAAARGPGSGGSAVAPGWPGRPVLQPRLQLLVGMNRRPIRAWIRLGRAWIFAPALMFEAMAPRPLITTRGERAGTAGRGLDTARAGRPRAGLRRCRLDASDQAGQAGQSGQSASRWT